MNIANILKRLAGKISKVYDAGIEQGKQAQLDEFWDIVQSKGTKTDYQCAFAGTSWNDKTFKPKYNIKPINAYHMFNRSTIGDLKGILDEQGVNLDLSKAFDTTNLFANCRLITHIGEINLSGISGTYLGETFFYCSKLHTIEKLVILDKKYTFTNIFYLCDSLENITIDGVIANSIDFRYSTKLTHDSLMSIINALKDYSADTSGTTYKLTIGSDNISKLTDEEQLIARNKGWNLA